MPELIPSTLVIADASAAGMAWALSAAAQGAKIALLEKQHSLETVTQTLIHTLCGFFPDQGELLNISLSEARIE